jgi:WD40 repeat protein
LAHYAVRVRHAILFMIAVSVSVGSFAVANTSEPPQPRLVMQSAHSTLVADFVYSQDSRRMATLGMEGTVKVWNTETGTVMFSVIGYGIRGIAFHPLESTLAGIDRDGTIWLFDGFTGDPLRSLDKNKRAIPEDDGFFLSSKPIPLAFTPDGKFLVNGGESGLFLWDVASGKMHKDLSRKARVDVFAVDPAGRSVAAAVSKNLIVLYSTSKGKKLEEFPAQVGEITSMEYGPDGRFIVIGSAAGTIRIFDIKSGKEVGEPPVYSICDKTYEYVPAEGSKLRKIGGFAKMIPGVGDIIETAETVAEIGETASMICRQVQKPAEYAEQGAIRFFYPSSIKDIALNPDEEHLAYRLGNGIVRVMNSKERRVLYEIDRMGDFKPFDPGESEAEREEWMAGFGMLMTPVRFSTDGKTLNAISQSKTITRWETKTGKHLDSLAVSNRDLSNGVSLFPLPMGAVPYFSADGSKLFTSTILGGTKVWDLQSGESPELVSEASALMSAPPISNDGRLEAVGEFSGEGEFHVVVRKIPSGEEIQRFPVQPAGFQLEILQGEDGPVTTDFLATFSPDNTKIALQVVENNAPRIRVYDLASGAELYNDSMVWIATFSPDGGLLANRKEKEIHLIDTDTWKVAKTIKLASKIYPVDVSVHFSSDGARLAAFDGAFIKLWDTSTGKTYRTHELPADANGGIALAPNKPVVTYTNLTTLYHWDYENEIVEKSGNKTDLLGKLAYSPDGRLLALGGSDDLIRLFDVEKDVEVLSIIAPRQDEWIIASPDGRFDSRWLEDIREAHWLMPDDPYTPYPLELFTREYFEPRLLSKVFNDDDLPQLPRVAGLNRALPMVEINSVSRTGKHMYRVSVSVSESESSQQTGSDGRSLRSGAEGLRLFRNGQLVAYAPADLGDLSLGSSGSGSFGFEVSVPSGNVDEAIRFSAYAFNADGVRSRIANYDVDVPPSDSQRARRAYLVSIGVNATEDPRFNLRYAANDASLILETLARDVGRAGVYEDVVQIPLISDGQDMLATTARIKGVLDLLAGRATSDSELVKSSVPNARLLREATPDDLVLVTLAGHGYTGREGIFYFVPSDIGNTSDGTLESIVAKLVSSDQLSDWLRDIDAGELVMVVDACYSASIVESGAFKPGPLGSKGLGQLSYDKGMRILTATQANDVALELSELGHGILTYALVADGLQARKADFRPINGQITMVEWLRYGVERVPQLHEDALNGTIAVSENGAKANKERGSILLKESTTLRQQPSVFDFSRRADDPVLIRVD